MGEVAMPGPATMLAGAIRGRLECELGALPVVAVGIANPLDPLCTRTRREYAPGCTVRECVRDIWPMFPRGRDLVIAIDGQLCPNAETALERTLRAGQSVVFSARPRGGGGGGKNIISTVGMIALMVAAPYMVPEEWAASFAYGMNAMVGDAAFMTVGTATSILGGAISLGGSMLISAFTATGATSTAASATASTSESPSWSDAPNPVEEGGPWPIIYGTAKVKPRVIAWHKTYDGDNQYLHCLYALADHALDSIDEIYINDNPVSFYGDGVTVEKRLGALDQEPISFFNETISEKTVNMKLSTAYVTARTDGNACQGLGIILYWNTGLGRITGSGDFATVTETFSIQYRQVGDTDWVPFFGSTTPTPRGTWAAGTSYAVDDSVTSGGVTYYCTTAHTSPTRVIDGYNRWDKPIYRDAVFADDAAHWTTTFTAREITQSVDGATGSAFYKLFRCENVSVDGGQYDIRIAFTSAQDTTALYRTQCYFAGIQEIIYDPFSYPGRSVVGMKILANDLISTSTSLTVELIATRATVPIYDGTVWSNQDATIPAWAAWDFLHNGDYGGNIPVERIVYAQFEDWAAWNVTKSKYRCNICIDSISTHKSWMDQIALLGRGTVVPLGTKFTCIVERPEPTPSQRFFFNVGNIRKASFKEELMSTDERANCIEVTYKDKDANYSEQTLTLYAEGYDASTEQAKVTTVKLTGCTTAAQALAHAQSLLKKNRYLTNTVTFGADVDAIGVMPGNVIDVQHDVPQWGFGGHVLSSTENATVGDATTAMVTLDREVDMVPGTSYALQVALADDTRLEYPVSSVGSETTTDTLTIEGGWDEDGQPQPDDRYSFGPVGAVSKAFTVLKIERADDFTRTIKALEYREEVFDDDVDVPPVVNQSSLAGVVGLAAVENYTVINGTPIPRIDLSWRGVSLAFSVAYRVANTESWTTLGGFTSAYATVDAAKLTPGTTYDFRVTAKDGTQSSASLYYQGGPTPPDVTGLYEFAQGGLAYIAADNADVPWNITYVVRKGTSWPTAQTIGEYAQPLAQVNGAGTYWMAVHSGTLYSENPISITVTADGLDANIIATFDEAATGWLGDKTDGLAKAGDTLRLVGLGDLWEAPDLWSIPDLYSYGGFVPEGTYTLPDAHVVSLATEALCNVTLEYSMYGDCIADDWYKIQDMWTVQDLWGIGSKFVSAIAEIRIYKNGAWGEWFKYSPGAYYGEKFSARLRLFSTDATVTPVVTALVFSVDVPDRNEWEKGVTIPSSGYAFTYAKPFNAIPATIVQILDAQDGDTVVLPESDQTIDGGIVSIVNSGNPVSRNANLIHRGY